MFQDKTLVCKDCGQQFTFTAGEQEFYAQKGFANEPTRCKDCRAKNKNARNSTRNSGERKMYDAVCAQCGKRCKVPFQPRENGRPVLCDDCFKKNS